MIDVWAENGRASQIRLQVVKRVERGDLLPHIDANVAQGANVFTDARPEAPKEVWQKV